MGEALRRIYVSDTRSDLCIFSDDLNNGLHLSDQLSGVRQHQNLNPVDVRIDCHDGGNAKGESLATAIHRLEHKVLLLVCQNLWDRVSLDNRRFFHFQINKRVDDILGHIKVSPRAFLAMQISDNILAVNLSHSFD